MRKPQIHIIILLFFLFTGCKKTSTPNQYLNGLKIEQFEYKADKKQLATLIKLRRDSIRSSSATPQGKSLETYIDTIFYSQDNKIVFLAITKKENQFAMNDVGISYAAECYIGMKNVDFNKIKILDRNAIY